MLSVKQESSVSTFAGKQMSVRTLMTFCEWFKKSLATSCHICMSSDAISLNTINTYFDTINRFGIWQRRAQKKQSKNQKQTFTTTHKIETH